MNASPLRVPLLVGSLVLVAAGGACSSSSGAGGADAGGTCSVVVAYDDAGAAACPLAVPSYEKDVLPILQADCIPCHSPGGPGGFSEVGYSDVYNQRSPMFSQVATCEMPPLNGPQLSNAQRTVLVDWFACGAPNN